MSITKLNKELGAAKHIRGLKDIRITIKFPVIVVALALLAAA